MLAKPQGFPRKLGGCAGLDPRLRSAVSAGVGDGERGLRRGLRAPGVGVRPKWVLEYSPSNKRIRYFVSITYVRTGLWTAHKFCGGGNISSKRARIFTPDPNILSLWSYSIQQDESSRIWAHSTANALSNFPGQNIPSLVRCTLGRNSGRAEYWALPWQLFDPYQLKYDKGGRIWFANTLVNSGGIHQFGVFDPAKNEATGFSIDGIGTVGASDIAVDTPNTTVWLTHRFPDAVYRYDWNTKEAIAYEDPGLYRPGLNDLGAKRVPVFVSGDGHVNTLVPDRKTSVIKISTTKYKLRHRVTELTSHELGVTEFKDKVPMNTNNEPEIYTGPFIRWSAPAITGGPTLVDIKNIGNKVYFIATGDAQLGMMQI